MSELKLEREECSRCGGSGHYSYCQMYGTTCFQCAGKKVVLTKRGAMANAYLEKIRSKPIEEIKVGDKIRKDNRTFTVIGIESESGTYTANGVTKQINYVKLICDGPFSFGLSMAEGSLVRIAQNQEQATATLKLAIEYQNSLKKV